MATTKRQNSNDALLIETATNVKNLSDRLFGASGDGGAIHFIMNQYRDLDTKLDTNKQELLTRIDTSKGSLETNIETKKIATDAAIALVSTAQQATDQKIQKVVNYGSALYLAGGLVATWLGLRKH